MIKKLLFILLLWSNYSFGQFSVNKAFYSVESSDATGLAGFGAFSAKTLTANKLYISINVMGNTNNTPTYTSTSLTWNTLIDYSDGTRRIFIIYCMPTATVNNEDLTIFRVGNSISGFCRGTWEFSGVPTGSNGANAIEYSATNSGTSADPSVTLSSFKNSFVGSVFSNNATPFSGTEESGWTEDFDDDGDTNGFYVMSRSNTVDNTPTVTSASSTWIGAAFVIRQLRRLTLID